MLEVLYLAARCVTMYHKLVILQINPFLYFFLREGVLSFCLSLYNKSFLGDAYSFASVHPLVYLIREWVVIFALHMFHIKSKQRRALIFFGIRLLWIIIHLQSQLNAMEQFVY